VSGVPEVGLVSTITSGDVFVMSAAVCDRRWMVMRVFIHGVRASEQIAKAVSGSLTDETPLKIRFSSHFRAGL
jgi:hypothetical protein